MAAVSSLAALVYSSCVSVKLDGCRAVRFREINPGHDMACGSRKLSTRDPPCAPQIPSERKPADNRNPTTTSEGMHISQDHVRRRRPGDRHETGTPADRDKSAEPYRPEFSKACRNSSPAASSESDHSAAGPGVSPDFRMRLPILSIYWSSAPRLSASDQPNSRASKSATAGAARIASLQP
jgi:hypothetical protein